MKYHYETIKNEAPIDPKIKSIISEMADEGSKKEHLVPELDKAMMKMMAGKLGKRYSPDRVALLGVCARLAQAHLDALLKGSGFSPYDVPYALEIMQMFSEIALRQVNAEGFNDPHAPPAA